MKLRAGQISFHQRTGALTAFADMKAQTLKLFPVMPDDFLQAARFADAYTFGLRAGDDLHLAVASRNAATLATRDRKLADAAVKLTVLAQLL